MDRRGFLSSMPACSPFLFCSWECGGGPRGPRTARQAGAPGGEAVAFRLSTGAGRGRGWRPGAGRWPWTEPVAFTAASGPAAACVSLPVRSWPRTLLLPSGVGTGRGGVGEQCCFCSTGSRFCPFQGLGHSCAGPCLPWVMCQTPSATLGGSRWAGVLSGGAAVPRAPRRRPAAPKAIPLPSPQRRIPRDRFLPGPNRQTPGFLIWV